MVNLGNYHITNEETSITEETSIKGKKNFLSKFSMVTVSSVVLVVGAQDIILLLAEETAKI